MWNVFAHKGRRVMMHGGSVDGFRTSALVVPQERLGVSLLTNTDTGAQVAASVLGHVLDQALGGETVDWSAMAERTDDDEAAVPRESVDAQRFIGRYRHEGYGEAAIFEDAGSLRCSFESLPGFEATLRPSSEPDRFRLFVDDDHGGAYDTGHRVSLTQAAGQPPRLSYSPNETFVRYG